MVQSKPEDEHDQQLFDDIERVGWHLVGITDDEGDGPLYVFTIGLHHKFGHPELCIFGLNDLNTMAQILNNAGQLIQDGAAMEDQMATDQLVEGYECMIRRVNQEHYHEYFGYARWYYEGDNFPMLQCFWPDKQRNYPWDPGYPEEMQWRQPQLMRASVWPFPDAMSTAVYTTKPVMEQGHPIRLVVRDSDGDWQFLCNTTNAPEDVLVVSLGDMVKRFPWLTQYANLAIGDEVDID